MALRRMVAAVGMVVACVVVRPAPLGAIDAGPIVVAGTVALACPGMGYPVPGTPSATCPFAFLTVACFNSVAAVAKPKPPLHTGTCGMTLTGAATGWCGLTSGDVLGVFVDAGGTAYGVDAVFTVRGGVLQLTGSMSMFTFPLQSGPVEGTGTALTRPPPVAPPADNCALGTGTTMTVAATLAFAAS